MSAFTLHDKVEFYCCDNKYEGEIIAIDTQNFVYYIATEDKHFDFIIDDCMLYYFSQKCFCVDNITDFIGKRRAMKESHEMNLVVPKQAEKVIKYKYRTKDLYYHYMLDNINSFLEEGERIISLSLSAGNSSHYVILIESQEIGESK